MGIIERKPALIKNAIPNQTKTSNSLSIHEWNTFINQLRTQTNINTEYLEKLHYVLFGPFDPSKPPLVEVADLSTLTADINAHTQTITEINQKIDAVDSDVNRIDESVVALNDDISTLKSKFDADGKIKIEHLSEILKTGMKPIGVILGNKSTDTLLNEIQSEIGEDISLQRGCYFIVHYDGPHVAIEISQGHNIMVADDGRIGQGSGDLVLETNDLLVYVGVSGVKHQWMVINNTYPTANANTYGVVMLATEQEALEGTDQFKAMTPKGVKLAIPTKISDLTNDAGYITDYTETDPIFAAWDKSTGISITKSQVSDLIEATQSLSGLMSATDKQRLDVLHALLEEDTENNVVDSINEVLAIFNNYPEGADLVTALAGKVDKNNAITAGTKTKITYDAKGLVTGGADLEVIDIPELPQTKITDLGTDLGNKVTKNADIVGATKPKITYDSKGLVTAGDDLVAADIPTLEISKITGLQTALDDKLDKNNAITADTKAKITYDTKGLVTGGSDLVASDIPQLEPNKITQDANNRFVTDTEKSTWNGKQDALTAGDGISIVDDVISADSGLNVETWDTATKTLALSDANKLFLCSYTDNQTLIIPTDATVAFPIGTMITFLLTGTNKITFSGQSGVDILSMDNLVELATQYGMASLIKIYSNTWQLVGALE